MKKLIAGCLIVAVIGIVALGAALYFGYRAARPMIDNAASYLDSAREVVELGAKVENKDAFPVPASGELTEAQVQRFLRVHERVRATLGSRWSELEARAKALEQKTDPKAPPSLTEIASLLSGFGGIVLDARRAHVDALNAERFSSEEYSWVRLRMYEAAGLELAGGLDWSALEDVVKRGAEQVGVEPPKMSVEEFKVPERNRALVKPHAEKLKEWLPLAVLGL